MDKVAGFLEVWQTDDTHEIVINRPDWKVDANRVGHIVLSPRHARHLASLLIMHAEEVEDAALTQMRA